MNDQGPWIFNLTLYCVYHIVFAIIFALFCISKLDFFLFCMLFNSFCRPVTGEMMLFRLTRYRLTARSSREWFSGHTLYAKSHVAPSAESVVRAFGRRMCPTPVQQQYLMNSLHSLRNIHTTR